MEGDASYFTRRANEERRAAMKAVNPQAREAHLEMAGRYSELAAAIASREALLGPEITGQAIS